jgi:hypothetical protein
MASEIGLCRELWKYRSKKSLPQIVLHRYSKRAVGTCDVVDGVENEDEVLKELAGHVLIDGVPAGQDEADLQHDHTEKRHPRRPIRLDKKTKRR